MTTSRHPRRLRPGHAARPALTVGADAIAIFSVGGSDRRLGQSKTRTAPEAASGSDCHSSGLSRPRGATRRCSAPNRHRSVCKSDVVAGGASQCRSCRPPTGSGRRAPRPSRWQATQCQRRAGRGGVSHLVPIMAAMTATGPRWHHRARQARRRGGCRRRLPGPVDGLNPPRPWPKRCERDTNR